MSNPKSGENIEGKGSIYPTHLPPTIAFSFCLNHYVLLYFIFFFDFSFDFLFCIHVKFPMWHILYQIELSYKQNY